MMSLWTQTELQYLFLLLIFNSDDLEFETHFFCCYLTYNRGQNDFLTSILFMLYTKTKQQKAAAGDVHYPNTGNKAVKQPSLSPCIRSCIIDMPDTKMHTF